MGCAMVWIGPSSILPCSEFHRCAWIVSSLARCHSPMCPASVSVLALRFCSVCSGPALALAAAELEPTQPSARPYRVLSLRVPMSTRAENSLSGPGQFNSPNSVATLWDLCAESKEGDPCSIVVCFCL